MSLHLHTCAVRQVRHDNAVTLALYHRFAASRSAMVRGATARQLCVRLETQHRLSQEILYPALRKWVPDHPLLGGVHAGAEALHAAIERVRSIAPDDPGLDEAVTALMRSALHRMADEETELLPLAQRQLADDLQALGRRMNHRRRALARTHVAERTLDALRATPVRSTLLVLGGVALAAALLGLSHDRRLAPALARLRHRI